MKYKNAILVRRNKSDRFVAFPPAIAKISADGKRCKSQVNDPCIEAGSWFFSQLLSCFSADRTLCSCQLRKSNY